MQLKLLQKASGWAGLVFPVETIGGKLCPPSQSPTRPGLLARKRRGKLVRLLLSVTPTSIQNFLGYLPTDWGQSNVSKGKSWGLLERLGGNTAWNSCRELGKVLCLFWVW